MALHAQRKYSFADYLVAERKADVRHEYVDGHVYDMVGATGNHNIIVTNIVSGLRFQMKARPCAVYASDMKVRIDAADAGKYPDVLALCGERQFYDDQRDVLLNSSLTVEVLSKSTEAYVGVRSLPSSVAFSACVDTCLWLRTGVELSYSRDRLMIAGC
jgi:Uma2 family endonuclease